MDGIRSTVRTYRALRRLAGFGFTRRIAPFPRFSPLETAVVPVVPRDIPYVILQAEPLLYALFLL